MTTIKAEFNNNEIIDINNNFINNYYKRKDNFYCSSNSRKISKNLLNMFNSCSKKFNIDGSSLNIENNTEIKKINNSSFQEIMDLFSDKSSIINDKNENNNIKLDTNKKINLLKEFNTIFESNFFSDNKKNNSLFINNSTKNDLNIINSNDNSSNHLSKRMSSSLFNKKTNSDEYNKKNNKDNKDNDEIVCYSPINQKIKNFDLDSPFNNSLFSNEYTLYDFPPIFGTDIKYKNIERSQEIINKIIKTTFNKEILDLTESPLLINTSNQNSFEKPFYKTNKKYLLCNTNTNNKNNDDDDDGILLNSDLNSKNKSYEKSKLDESQMPNTIYDISFYLNLISQSNSYPKIKPNTLFKKNPTIKWENRLKIFLWMMKNCEEFAYKRDTFHYSINYFDLFLYLSKEEIKKKDLKLIGITCISLAAKIEEIQIPKLIEYAKSIDPKFTDKNLIISMETKICSTLKWKLIPITIEIWLNWYTTQWDLYIDSSDEIKIKLMNYIKEEDIIYFKKQDDKAYCNYRRIYQLIDLICLDFNNYNYDKRGIIVGCFFECLCFEYNLDYNFDKKKLYSKQNKLKEEFINILQELFNLFVEQSFDYNFNDQMIQKCIKYVFNFRKFSFSYNMPLIYKTGLKIDEDIEYNYEDFISYQTTNSDIYPFFEKMYKKENNKNNKNNKSIKKQVKNT